MTEFTEQDFYKEVLECELPVFACFTTEWCASCYPTCLFADQLVKENECAEVCPVDACVPDPDHEESREQLLEKWHSLHPGETPAHEP